MRIDQAETARESFRQLQADKRLEPMQQDILDVLKECGPSTRKQLHSLTGMALSSVCGRVRSLIDAGIVKVHTVDGFDFSTGKRQQRVYLPSAEI